MSVLKRVLFDEYGGFADKRIKKLESGSIFIADDRGPEDFGANKNLFLWFCAIFVEVESESAVSVSLYGGVPRSPEIESWARSNKLKFEGTSHLTLEIPLSKGEQDKLLELVSLIAAVVAPGKRYPVAAYKYVCPRAAKSLRRLMAVLSTVWST